jgi:hypothetical protein
MLRQSGARERRMWLRMLQRQGLSHTPWERPSPANQRSADSGIYNSSAQDHMTMPVEVALAQLRADARDLWMPREVPRLAVPPTPLAFLRDFVMPSTPVIVRGALREWR